MATELLPPYASVPISGYMRREFKRRRDTYGSKFVKSDTYGTTNSPNMADYRGSMTSWIRVVSNGITKYGGSGFVLKGGDGFNKSYGIGGSNGVIGYTHDGKPHIIDNQDPNTYQKYRPIPGIESIEVDIRKDVYRMAFIKWKCYSVEQLNYMMPYMFNPYTTVFLEWGWNTYNPLSLIDISNPGTATEFEKGGSKIVEGFEGTGMIGAYMNPLLIENGLEISDGRYDGMVGHIINFDYTFNPSEMCFNCTTEIASNSRFYFGLSSNSITAKNDAKDIENFAKALRSEYFTKSIRAALNYYSNSVLRDGRFIKKREQTGQESALFDMIKYRVFSPTNFFSRVIGGSESFAPGSKIYLSFGLLVDILNDNNTTAITPIEINIEEQKIGAHPNLVSCSDKFLIPNSGAPYFNPMTLADSSRRSSGAYKDEPILYEAPSGKNKQADKLLNLVLATNRRQNLDTVINHLQIKSNRPNGATQFPSEGNSYEGLLKNIYLSFDFVEEQLKSTPDLRSFLKSICEMLNDNVTIWRLEVIDWDGKLSIRDLNYLDVEILTKRKEKFGIDSKDAAIYMFDAFTQDSFLKEFGFNVKLSDAVANAVVNQVNNQIVSDKNDEGENKTGNVTNQTYLFPTVNDVLLRELPMSDAGATKSVSTAPPLTQSEKEAYAISMQSKLKNRLDEMNNIDERTIPFGRDVDVTLPDGRKQKRKGYIRLVMPGESGKAKLMQLMDDNSAEFSNISTMPIPGVKVEFSILGISGFKMFQIFGVNNLPKPYNDCFFQITELKHSVTDAGWITRVTAAVRPRGSILTLI